MISTIEIGARFIRFCLVQQDRITALEEWPVPEDSDPIDSLAIMPFPAGVGKVRVVTHHQDMLLSTMIQPPCPPERLERIIHFEMNSTLGESATDCEFTWHVTKTGSLDEMRVLVLSVKKDLLQRITTALKPHNIKLASLIDPCLALFHAYKNIASTVPTNLDQDESEASPENAILLDCRSDAIHSAIILDGELCYYRSNKPGFDDLIEAISQLRNIDRDSTVQLLTKLRTDLPDDLKNLISRQAASISTTITNTVRFTQAQLHMPNFSIDRIHLAGSAGQISSLDSLLHDRARKPVTFINPFISCPMSLPMSWMDEHALLPNSWTTAIGGALLEQPELDGMSSTVLKKNQFWLTKGLLRASIVAAAIIILITTLAQTTTHSHLSNRYTLLEGTNQSGLVPIAQTAHADLERMKNNKMLLAQHMTSLRHIRRTDHIAREFLSLVATLQDPETCPITLDSFAVNRTTEGNIEIHLVGFAKLVGSQRSADILNNFENELKTRYPAISSLHSISMPPDPTRHAFGYRISIAH